MAARELDVTRIVRLALLADREKASNSCTVVGSLRSQWLSVPSLFNAHQRVMAAALERERRPGAMAFLLTAQDVEGWFWLSATDDLRAGTLGRHGCVDLHVPHESGLSLRHCLFLVRRAGERVVTHVVDLSSASGLRLEDQRPARAITADGPFFLYLPGAVAACFPTGGPLPWDPNGMPAFASLAPRRFASRLEGAPMPPHLLHLAMAAPRDSNITLVKGPVPAEVGALLEPGEVPAGELLLASTEGCERLAVGFSALDRGVVLGRYDRCVGSPALRHRGISRVHSLLVRRDERLYLADAGSTNGTWLGEEEIKCARVKDRTEYLLGGFASLRWTPFD